MPMMLDHPAYTVMARSKEQPQGHQTYYGHQREHATKCGHTLHPSASQRTPLCPTCTISAAKSNMDVALKELVAKGGLAPAEYMRDRQWQRAKLRYEIAKQRQTKARSRDQLREEREQTWEESHQRFSSQRLQAAATFRSSAECHACASMIACYPTKVSDVQAAKHVAWWERPGGLATGHILVPKTPLRPVKQAWQTAHNGKGSSALRIMVRDFRRAMTASDAQRQLWETRNKTESAVRRKHSLGEGYHFEPDFWDSPISAHLSRRNHQHVKDTERMAARRARGNTSRSKPPRSSLSYSKHIDEVEIDDTLMMRIVKSEEFDRVQREVRKVGEEVGYLYFVGKIDGFREWREEFLRSDRQLVYRKAVSQSEGELPRSEYEDVDEDEDQEYKESYEEMDVDDYFRIE